MRHITTTSIARCFGTFVLLGAAFTIATNAARAQSGFYIGPSGIGFGYEDDNVGVIIGNSPYDRHDHYDHDRHHRDRYYDDRYRRYEFDEQSDYYETPRAVEQTPEPVIDASADAAEYQAAAEDAFHSGDYANAARWSRHAIVEDPRNGGLHLFAGQVYFATGEFARSAAAVQRGMALSKQDQWGQVVENYAKFYKGSDYVDQMKLLAAFIKKNPRAPYSYFLRGYHYGFLGHEKAARKDLAKAFELENRDHFASELLVMMGGDPPAKPVIAAPQPIAESATTTLNRPN